MIANYILEKIYRIPRFTRVLLLIIIDVLVIKFSIYLAFNFNLENKNIITWLTTFITFFSLLTYSLSGLYLNITRYIGSKTYYSFIQKNLLIIFAVFLAGTVFKYELPEIQYLIKIIIFQTSFIVFIRILIRDFILKFTHDQVKYNKVAIYGAGAAGSQLLSSLRLSGKLNIVAFFDDNPSLWGRKINQVKIYPPSIIPFFKKDLKQILLAIPSIKIERKREIIKTLQNIEIPLLDIPSIDEITKEKKKIDTLRPIPIEELLGREVIEAQNNLLKVAVQNKSILITGAGGSIGSELCRQVINHQPKKVVMLEISEENLYLINEEMEKINQNNIEIISILGSCTNLTLLNKVIKENQVNIIFHASAYKHVPLVELNPLEGIKNNVFSTEIVCKASVENNIEKFILISTDKSVRPTNIMGASKRVAELIVQAYAEKESLKSKENINHQKTLFSMVRFGNVLGSSGSVVPKFKKQIENGGPITLTDPNIIRYFMTIKEAAQLVIQSSVLSEGGDIFY